jgi:CRISPR-associated protein Cas1
VLWPLTGHFNQAAKIDAQLSVGRVLKKRLWQAIVKNKILAQAMVLEVVGQSSDALRHMASRVRSGDEGNLEAQASRRYWPLLFGADFRRERHGKGPNPLLNYGYAVIRSAMARAVVATGLHPSVGIFHSNRANAFRLVDDLMEPFRPFVDAKVWWLYEKQGCRALNTRVKRALVDILEFEVARDGQKIRLRHHINHFAQSLGKSYLNKANELVLPEFTAQVFARLMQDEEEQVSSDVVDGDV